MSWRSSKNVVYQVFFFAIFWYPLRCRSCHISWCTNFSDTTSLKHASPGESKNYPRVICRFLKNGWNFNIEMYTFIQHVHVCFHAKQNFINFTNGEVREYSAWPPCNCHALKSIRIKIILLYQNNEYHWHFITTFSTCIQYSLLRESCAMWKMWQLCMDMPGMSWLVTGWFDSVKSSSSNVQLHWFCHDCEKMFLISLTTLMRSLTC